MPKQTHIFATRSDLEPGLRKIEGDMAIRYARCGMYDSPVVEQYSSLLAWEGLGKNSTGDHISGPNFLVVPRECNISVEQVFQTPIGRPSHDRLATQRALVIQGTGQISPHLVSLGDYLDELERTEIGESETVSKRDVRFSVSQKLNPESITFLPGGAYKGEGVLVCGHIGSISQSPISLSLYRSFVKAVTKGFKKIGSYFVGPEAGRLMDRGSRMVTISIGSPIAYDLRRPG